jgi:hypothetical protein
VTAETLQDFQLLWREGIELRVGRREDSHELVLDDKGDGDLGEGGGLAGEVVGVLADVGGVSYLAGGGDVSD